MANKQEVARPIERMKFSSRVDIVIPFHGQYERVTRLVESVFRSTFSNVYQVILVDDGSANSTFISDLTKVPNLDCVRLEEQKGFGGAILAGFKRSEEMNLARREKNQPEHAYVTFVQSDCLVEDVNWLRAMGETMLNLKSSGVKMVGARTNNPMTGDERQKGEKMDDIEDFVLDESSLAMHCFMVHRDLFRHIGGFIKEYPYGCYEDEEFAYRLKAYGFKQAISGRSWVRHAGGATLKSVYRDIPTSRRSLEENRLRAIKDVLSIKQSVG